MLAIITPTYNRAYTLKNVYKSLKKQTNKNFEWYIVDDGSNDNTKEVVESFKKDNIIKINYYYKKNGGKHTAINYAVKRIKNDYILILDSDDELIDNAVNIALLEWEKYKNDSSIACLSFLKVFPNNKIIGKKYEEKEIRSNHIDFRYNRKLLGDMCEIWRSSVLKKYPFPIFENEKFLSEAIIWNKIALNYDTIYINKPIYIAEYLDDGLSKNSLKMRYYNPIGALENANVFLSNRFNKTIRLKNAVLYDAFSIIAKRNLKDIIKKSNNKMLSIIFLPTGYICYLYIKIKCH